MPVARNNACKIAWRTDGNKQRAATAECCWVVLVAALMPANSLGTNGNSMPSSAGFRQSAGVFRSAHTGTIAETGTTVAWCESAMALLGLRRVLRWRGVEGGGRGGGLY